jgi:hypothetical protein
MRPSSDTKKPVPEKYSWFLRGKLSALKSPFLACFKVGKPIKPSIVRKPKPAESGEGIRGPTHQQV